MNGKSNSKGRSEHLPAAVQNSVKSGLRIGSVSSQNPAMIVPALRSSARETAWLIMVMKNSARLSSLDVFGGLKSMIGSVESSHTEYGVSVRSHSSRADLYLSGVPLSKIMHSTISTFLKVMRS